MPFDGVVFPARAGMSRHGLVVDGFVVSVPRASGDEPVCKTAPLCIG